MLAVVVSPVLTRDDDKGDDVATDVEGSADEAALDAPGAEQSADDVGLSGPGDDPATGAADATADSGTGDDPSTVPDGTTDEGDATATATAADGESQGAAGDATVSANPLSVALMVADAGALTPQERSLIGMLEGNGHTVSPFTVTVEPIVNAVNNPTIDLLLFSPSFEFSTLYHPAQPDSLPMLDMAKYSWYRRYVLPWNDEIAGPRFAGAGEFGQEIHYEDADVIAWDGQAVGPVEVVTVPRFAGEAPSRQAMDHATNGAAQHFLRQTSDTGAQTTQGVYVPAGSTITAPAPTTAEERRVTSVVPWIGLLVFVDDGGDGNQYAELTPAGEGLFEAAMQHLVNP